MPIDAPQQFIFRAMKAAPDGHPQPGRSRRELGVRLDGPSPDLPVTPTGIVQPRTGGMSIALDAARNLPKSRLPRSLGGDGRDPVFTLASGKLPVNLSLREDHYPHALIEPTSPCLLADYEAALHSTRTNWSKAS